MHHDTHNLQRVDYIKVLCPQETNSSNQGLEIDIKPTIIRPTTNHGCGAPEAGLSSELHLVTNHAPADHNLVTWVHQLEVGERRAAPLGLTPPGGFLAVAEGRLTAASFSLTTDQRFQIALLAGRPLRR